MNQFSYVRVDDVAGAVRARAQDPKARFIAGGTNIVDLIKYHVEQPTSLIDITRLPLNKIEEIDGGGLRIGALVPNSDLAYDRRVEERYPLLASAILAGASPQLRNMASTGGNLLQRTRCHYFYDTTTPCNKREPGSGCSALTGLNRQHAILGASDQCIATHPSDMCVALAALGASVRVAGSNGERSIPFADFHRLPGNEPERDTNLGPDDLILSVDLPASDFSRNYTYLKLRDRLSYAFALVSVAAALRFEAGEISEARLAMGGVAHKPWRDLQVEEQLKGRRANKEGFERAAEQFLSGAQGKGFNDYKIGLAHRAIVRALSQATAGTPQSQTDKRIQ